MTTANTFASPLPRSDDNAARGVTVLKYVALALVAGVLGFAAVMKLTTGAGAMDYLIGALEIAFIAGMIVFRNRWWAWGGATALFSVFAGYTAYLIVRGEGSCGCFGSIETPPTLTFSIDVFMAALSALVALALTRSIVLVGALLTVMGTGAVAGAGVSVITAVPLATDFHGDRAGLLAEAPGNEHIANADYTDPDWLLYVYDENAAGASPMLEEMRADAQEHAEDEALRVKVMTTAEAEDGAGVPAWAWEKLPQAILYRGGRVVQRYMGEEIQAPQTLRETRPVGPIAQVLALPDYADIAYASDMLPIHLLYVYNPDCPICLEHLALLNHFIEEFPNDPNVVIMPISMLDLQEEQGIELWQWPGVPTSYVVRGGRVVAQTAGPGGVPNPYQIRMDLSQGRPLVLPRPNQGAIQQPDDHTGHDH